MTEPTEATLRAQVATLQAERDALNKNVDQLVRDLRHDGFDYPASNVARFIIHNREGSVGDWYDPSTGRIMYMDPDKAFALRADVERLTKERDAAAEFAEQTLEANNVASDMLRKTAEERDEACRLAYVDHEHRFPDGLWSARAWEAEQALRAQRDAHTRDLEEVTASLLAAHSREADLRAENARHLETIRALTSMLDRITDEAPQHLVIVPEARALIDASREYEQTDDVKGGG